MDIKIITTKKKLTKSLARQMFHLSPSLMKFAKGLGYINLGGKIGKRLLCQYGDDYYLINPKWELRGMCESCKPYWGYSAGYAEITKRFANNQDAVNFYNDYERLMAECERSGHIYL